MNSKHSLAQVLVFVSFSLIQGNLFLNMPTEFQYFFLNNIYNFFLGLVQLFLTPRVNGTAYLQVRPQVYF